MANWWVVCSVLSFCAASSQSQPTEIQSCKEYKLPEIDINLFQNGDATQRAQIASLFDTSFRNVGVVKLMNHSIPTSAINAAYSAGKAFFHLEATKKLQYRLQDTAKCGYTPLESLKTSSYDYINNTNVSRRDYDFAEMYFVQLKQLQYGDNITMDVAVDGEDSMVYPPLLAACNQYVYHLANLRRSVHEIVGMALGLPNIHHFEKVFINNPDLYYPLLVYLYYPSMETNDSESEFPPFRLKEHTDAMTFTFVRNDDVSGLQVFVDDEWRDVVSDGVQDAILLFAGDAVKVYTNDWWTSSRHRVVFHNNSERLTMSYFVGPDYDQMIQPLNCSKCDVLNTKYEPRTVEEHFRKRFDGEVDT